MKKLFSLILSIALFMPMAIAHKVVDGGGSGPFKAEAYSESTLPDHVVYRPVDLAAAVEHDGLLPLVVFANGACEDTSLPFERFLTDLASYGYVVVALGPLQMERDDRVVGKAPNSDMPKAIDWALEQNQDPTSMYCNTIDPEYIALAGMSCGGAQVMANSADDRVATYIMLNSGMGDMTMADASKENLKDVHGPILYVLGGESDIAYFNALKDYEAIDHVPVAFASHPDCGHGGTYHEEYGGQFSQMVRDWLGWQFKGKSNLRSVFVTRDLRKYPGWTMLSKNFLKDFTYQPQERPKEWPPKFDSAYPDVHDPVMAREDGRYYMFTTGMGIGMMSSDDLATWQQEKSPLNPIPQWAKEMVPAYKGHTWAPDIVKHGDMWYLYYSCSTFGKNISAIGVMCSPTLDPQKAQWTDLGMVVRSQPGINDWNAIDPNVNFDDDGNPWLTFGSFWDGIQLVRLDKDMHTMIGDPVTIARRRCPCKVAHNQEHANTNAIEAPFIVKHDGMYYLFVSYDYCCQGLASTYKTAVGRSANIEGPYTDINGTNFTQGGGDCFPIVTHPYKFKASDGWVGISHCCIFKEANKDRWFYMSQGRLPAGAGGNNWANAIMMGHVRQIVWCPASADTPEDLWPLALPERYAAVPDQNAITESEIVGLWEHIDLGYEYAQQQKAGTNLEIKANGTFAGPISGKWSYDASKQWLTLDCEKGKVVVCLARELDWEATPRKATIVYAGTAKNLNRTYWGKKIG